MEGCLHLSKLLNLVGYSSPIPPVRKSPSTLCNPSLSRTLVRCCSLPFASCRACESRGGGTPRLLSEPEGLGCASCPAAGPAEPCRGAGVGIRERAGRQGPLPEREREQERGGRDAASRAPERGRERSEQTAEARVRDTNGKPALVPHREPLEGASRGRDALCRQACSISKRRFDDFGQLLFTFQALESRSVISRSSFPALPFFSPFS